MLASSRLWRLRFTSVALSLAVVAGVGTAAGVPAVAAGPESRPEVASETAAPPAGSERPKPEQGGPAGRAAAPPSAPGQPAPEQTEPVANAQEEMERARQSKERVEVPGMRTETSTTYALPHGQLQTEVALLPIHYRDSAGAWQPMDTSLVPSEGGGWHAAAVGFQAKLPATLAAGPVRVAEGGTWVEMRLDGAADTPGVATGNSVTYPAVFPGVDVTFSVTGAGLQKMIKLLDRSARPDFAFDVTTSDKTALTPSKRDVRVSRPGSPGFVIPLPWAVDQRDTTSAPAGGKNVRLTTGRSAGGAQQLQLSLDPAWLADPARVFPVLLDPTLRRENATMTDCFLHEPQPVDTSYCGFDRLEIGGGTNDRRRAIMKFDLTVIPVSATVTDATVQGQTLAALAGTAGQSVTLHRLQSGWDGGTAAWNCRDQWVTFDGCNPWPAGGDFDPAVLASAQVAATADSYPRWENLSALMQGWVRSPAGNHGLLLKPATEPVSTVLALHASESTTSSNPRAFISWVPRLGEQSFEVMYRDRLTDRSDIGVNVATGNLIVNARDLAVSGTGQDFVVERTYNAQAAKHGVVGPVEANGSLGSGWNSGTLLDTALYVNPYGTSAEFYGPDGRIIRFTPNGSGGWKAPPAANATLAREGSLEYRLTLHDSNTRMFFSQGLGDEWPLNKILDRNNNAITTAFGGDGRIGSVSYVDDTQKRRFTLGYSTDTSNRKRLASVTDPTGRKQSYTYSTGQLASVQNGEPNVAATTYAYSSGLLSQITDPSGRQTRIAYDSLGRASSINRVTDPSTGAGHITRFAYPNLTTTTVTDANGKVTTYTLDADYRVSSVKDALGRTRSRTYTPNSTVASVTGAATGATTLTYGANNGESMTARQISTGATDTVDYTNPADSAGSQYLPTATKNPRQTKAGTKTELNYDAAGNLAQSMIATEGSRTAHNPNGTLRAVTTPNNVGTTSGRTACASSDPNRTGASTSTDNCTTISYAYNTAGQLTSKTTTPPVGTKWLRASTTNYDSLGRVSSSTDGRGITTTYSYDGLDRLKTIGYSDGTAGVSYSYDGAGNTLSTTDASGTTTVDYDPRNLPVARTIPNRGTLGYGYDGVGNLTASTEAAQQTDYVYDAVNNLDYLLEPGTLKTDFGYDPDDRRTTTAYPNGVVQTVKYDNAGRVKTVRTTKTTSTTTTTYVSLDYCYALPSSTSDCSTATGDDMNFLQYKRDNLTGKKTEYKYDGADRLDVAADGTRTYGYDYDKNGNRTVETVAGDLTENYSYEHDVADALCSRRSKTTTGASCSDTTSSAAKVLLVVGSPTSLTAGETKVRDRLQHTLGHKVTLRDDGDVEDVTGQDLVVISEQANSTTLATKYKNVAIPVLNMEFLSWDDHSYTAGTIYHTTGSTLTVEDATHPVANGPAGKLSGTFSHLTDSTRYTGLILDSETPATAKQIVAHGASTTYNVAFSYEAGQTMAAGVTAAGRRLALGYKEETINALTAQGWTLFDNAIAWVAEQVITTTSFTHDGAGNMTANGHTTAAYNGANQTTRYGAPTFSYAGTGQGDRIAAGGTTFTNGLLGTQRQTTSAGTTDFTSTPDGQLVSMTLPGGAKHYYLFDAQGSVLGLTDSAGTRTATYTYDPYGDHHTATGTAAGANPYRYISGYLDPDTGLYKLGSRYYNPDLGRFTQLDPSGQSAHYSYAENSPVNFVDPEGLASLGGIISDIGGKVLDFTTGLKLGKALARGDTEEAALIVASEIFGAITTALCFGITSAGASVTAGTTIILAVGCLAAGQAVSGVVQKAAENYGIETG